MATTKKGKTHKPSVLLIEDDTFLSGMYVKKLTLEGFDVQLATDGEEGLRQAKAVEPDIVLLDIVLPKMDGFKVLEGIKKDPAAKHIPVILLTNLGQKDDVDKGLSLGAADYLIKAHFMPSEVVAKVKTIVSQK
jgi:DNA-binding response OmpR family regulator